MGKYTILLFVLIAGAAQPFQVAMNSKLNKVSQSPSLAAMISFVGGALVVLLLYAVGIGGRGQLMRVGSMPWWAYLSGVLGVLIVVSSLVALPMSSAALVIACGVLGQAAASVAVDHFGWLEVKRVPITAWRVVGVLLIFAGTVMMQNFNGD